MTVDSEKINYHQLLKDASQFLQMQCWYQNITLYLVLLKTLRSRKAIKLFNVE
jgi:hypothetical protein